MNEDSVAGIQQTCYRPGTTYFPSTAAGWHRHRAVPARALSRALLRQAVVQWGGLHGLSAGEQRRRACCDRGWQVRGALG